MREDIMLKLGQWANKVEETLPYTCPKCGKTLDKIKYGYDRTRTTVHLTGAVNEQDYVVANCPYCGDELLRASAGDRYFR